MNKKEISIINLSPKPKEFNQIIKQGFSKTPKRLPSWLLYNNKGSKLFEEICKQPEYKLTEAENYLIQKNVEEIASLVSERTIVEFGAGNAKKIIPILNYSSNTSYSAIDIDQNQIQETLISLKSKFKKIEMIGICCDHTNLDTLPNHFIFNQKKIIGFFPGSSIGNFEPKEAILLLKNYKKLLKGGPLIIGIDHPKNKSKIEAAYNDSKGVSAEFAMNLLDRLNYEMNANFNIKNFHYEAEWQPENHRVEMRLKSNCNQIVRLIGKDWEFKNKEKLITEYSYKYPHDMAINLLKKSGWQAKYCWHHESELFSIYFLI